MVVTPTHCSRTSSSTGKVGFRSLARAWSTWHGERSSAVRELLAAGGRDPAELEIIPFSRFEGDHPETDRHEALGATEIAFQLAPGPRGSCCQSSTALRRLSPSVPARDVRDRDRDAVYSYASTRFRTPCA